MEAKFQSFRIVINIEIYPILSSSKGLDSLS